MSKSARAQAAEVIVSEGVEVMMDVECSYEGRTLIVCVRRQMWLS